MKYSIIKTLRIIAILLLLGAGDIMYAQLPPPPPSGSETEQNKLGPTDAPIGGGLLILLGLGAAYGGVKFYRRRRKLTD